METFNSTNNLTPTKIDVSVIVSMGSSSTQTYTVNGEVIKDACNDNGTGKDTIEKLIAKIKETISKIKVEGNILLINSIGYKCNEFMTELSVTSPNNPPILDISSLIVTDTGYIKTIEGLKQAFKTGGGGRKIYLLNRNNTQYKNESFGGNWAEESKSLIDEYNTPVNNVSQDSGPDFVVDLGGGSGTIYEKNNGKFTIYKNEKIITKMNDYLAASKDDYSEVLTNLTNGYSDVLTNLTNLTDLADPAKLPRNKKIIIFQTGKMRSDVLEVNGTVKNQTVYDTYMTAFNEANDNANISLRFLPQKFEAQFEAKNLLKKLEAEGIGALTSIKITVDLNKPQTGVKSGKEYTYYNMDVVPSNTIVGGSRRGVKSKRGAKSRRRTRRGTRRGTKSRRGTRRGAKYRRGTKSRRRSR